MTTQKEIERRIVGALWSDGLQGGFTENGIVIKSYDLDEFLITVTLIEDE